MKLTRREVATLIGVVLYAFVLIGGYSIIIHKTTEAATWERKYHTARETEERAVELLGATVREFEDYKVMVELLGDSEQFNEDYENESIEAALLAKAQQLDNVKVTFYCTEKRKHICGTGDGLTATGTEVTAYVTVAVDPKVIPLGSTVLVDFGDGVIHYFVAEDTGGAVKGNHIDIAVVGHREALELGTRTATVWYIK